MTNGAKPEMPAVPAAQIARTANSLKLLAPDTRAAMTGIGERIEVAAGSLLFAEDDQTNEL